MTDDILSMLAVSKVSKAEQTKKNREDFPFAAEFTDLLRSAGFSGKIKYTCENGKSLGKPLPETGWTDVDKLLNHVEYTSRKKKAFKWTR
jgi:hypothetical protein